MLFDVGRSVVVAVIAVGLALTLPAAAQTDAPVTAADIERASQFYPANVRKLVRNAAPMPNWIGQSDHFWYRHEVEGGVRFVTVNAATGKAEPSFDHASVAAMLSRELGRAVAPIQLPFGAISYSADLKTVTFTADKRTFACNRAATRCSDTSAAATDPATVASPDGRRALFERDHNLWLRDVTTGAERALTSDGSTDFPYRYTAYKTTFVEERRGQAQPVYPGATWSPDGRYILAIRTDDRGVKTAPYVTEFLPPDAPRPIAHQMPMPTPADAPEKRYHLVLIDLKDGGTVPVDGGALGFNDYAPYWALVGEPGWDISDNTLYLATSTRDSRALGLVAVDLDSGKSRTVVEERDAQFLNLNPFDYHVPNVRLLAQRDEILWWSQRSGWGASLSL
ncbi:DPP IV N-terminal domain-containing protein [Sphingomonas sp. J315]|uniref:DPP IV N-terminal domain-containing protein n=1 Tax=Sphingomonas sp. J315 TaxID=2898433 RepID=UPI0021AE298A|nr:DPP IV N-terminal domain-containing protein [Sphingomonas sp. J315]UUX99099.1 DPP IV N-terminal domain-containing protein [Sphingomonas sp. J315]